MGGGARGCRVQAQGDGPGGGQGCRGQAQRRRVNRRAERLDERDRRREHRRGRDGRRLRGCQVRVPLQLQHRRRGGCRRRAAHRN